MCAIRGKQIASTDLTRCRVGTRRVEISVDREGTNEGGFGQFLHLSQVFVSIVSSCLCGMRCLAASGFRYSCRGCFLMVCRTSALLFMQETSVKLGFTPTHCTSTKTTFGPICVVLCRDECFRVFVQPMFGAEVKSGSFRHWR